MCCLLGSSVMNIG
ncbi:hypothetical protein LINPERPRIM_LOCUS2911 [Linum perenne]